ncbi:MAG: DUF1800 family protein [Planctomycetota bacterium]
MSMWTAGCAWGVWVLILAAGAGAQEAGDDGPVARLRLDHHVGVRPLTVRFDASAGTGGTGGVATYRWEVAGRVIGDGAQAEHRFDTAGDHAVTLTVTDAAGRSARESAVVTVAERAWRPGPGPVDEAEARRFLWQAAFGPSPDDLAFVTEHGFAVWIDRQLGLRPTLMTERFARSRGREPGDDFQTPWLIDDLMVGGPDQLRQRTAWALAQVIPINAEAAIDNEEAFHGGLRRLYGVFLRHALPAERYGSRGRYDDLLVELTFNSAVAHWLTYKNSTRAVAEFGTRPDENYARELMQLFTIGVVALRPDGTPVRDAEGRPVPNYTNDDVKAFARVFTGMIDGDASEDEPFASTAEPVNWLVDDHDFGAKQLLVYPGVTPRRGRIPATRRGDRTERRARQEVRSAIGNLVHHPSHPPFLARRMIQRFTTSNPTPGYVRRVADAYAGRGPFGRGQRGDLAAMVRAVLLDDEARNPAYRRNPQHGLVLEPVRVLVGAARAYGLHEPAPFVPTTDLEMFWEMQELTGQGPFLTPSVFNFYLPDFSPPDTRLRALGLVAPELQVLDEHRALAGLAFMADSCWNLISAYRDGFWGDGFGVSEDPAALVAAVAGPLDHGWLDDTTRRALARAVRGFRDPEARAYAALYLTLGHPDFRVLR